MRPKIKVLFFIESLAGGGAEKILYTIANHLNKEKFDITISTVTTNGIYAEQISKYAKYEPLIKTRNQILYKILYHLIYYYLPLKMVYHFFFPKGNDVEIAFCEGFATKLLSFSPNKKKIAWVHIDILLNPWTQDLVYSSVDEEKRIYQKYNRVICVSKTVEESVKVKFGIDADTIYNPIDSDEIISKSKKIFLLPTKNRIRFVTVGRLVEQKGYDRLLKVVKLLKNEDYNFELWILGDGSEKKSLMEYIDENNLNDCVKVWGFTPNPYPYIVASDVFVCSSRSEGYSTAVTEAIILGLPIITTLCSGMKELLGDNNEYGIIVENEDLTLLEPLRQVISNPDYLKELALKAQKRSGDFKIASLIKPIEELLI